MSSDKKISIRMILEVVGRPPKHLTKTLEGLVEKIGSEKGVEIIEKNIHEPIELKERKEFFTSFVEVEVDIDEISILGSLILKYMPAHIEIIEPESFSLKNSSANDMFNEFAKRLHHYDEVARVMQAEKIILTKKLKSLLPEEKKD
ncbi:MAG: hypothetical protein OQK82_01520 [Candidatus Pacearchaeota archaeon]|nr:hypothetical protein [Candidatus Pacearchaeota archaeon]